MKILFDLFPVILFFIAFKIPEDPFQGILLATSVAIVASFVQVGFHWWKHRRFDNMQLVTLALIVVLGGATLLFQDERFIKWKPTVVNWLFALVLLGSQFVMRINLIRRMMEKNINLPDVIWSRLSLAWAAFFIIMGFANLYVAFNFETDIWVNFKLFGMMGLTLLFVFGQALYMSRYMDDTAETGESS